MKALKRWYRNNILPLRHKLAEKLDYAPITTAPNLTKTILSNKSIKVVDEYEDDFVGAKENFVLTGEDVDISDTLKIEDTEKDKNKSKLNVV